MKAFLMCIVCMLVLVGCNAENMGNTMIVVKTEKSSTAGVCEVTLRGDVYDTPNLKIYVQYGMYQVGDTVVLLNVKEMRKTSTMKDLDEEISKYNRDTNKKKTI